MYAQLIQSNLDEPGLCRYTATLGNDRRLLLPPAVLWHPRQVFAGEKPLNFGACLTFAVFCPKASVTAKQCLLVIIWVRRLHHFMRLFLIPLKTDFRKTKLPSDVRIHQNLAPAYPETQTCDNIRGRIRNAVGMFLAGWSLDVQRFPKRYDYSTHPSLVACGRPRSCVSHSDQAAATTFHLLTTRHFAVHQFDVLSEIFHASITTPNETNARHTADKFCSKRLESHYRGDDQHQHIQSEDDESDKERNKLEQTVPCLEHNGRGRWMPPLLPFDGTPGATFDNTLRHAAHSEPRARGASLAVSITHELPSYTTTFSPICHFFDGATTSVAKTFFYHVSSIHHWVYFRLDVSHTLSRLILPSLSWPPGATFPVPCGVCATKCSPHIYTTPPPRPDTEPYPTGPDQDYD
jgi:hypothetical protein